MSIHENPDASVTEGYKLEPNGTFVAHTLGIAVTASSGIGASVAAAKAAGANQAIIQADGNSVRYRLDTTAPTAAVSVLIANGASISLNMTDAAAALFIQTAATAVLNVTFTA